jgi:hypothetical protein
MKTTKIIYWIVTGLMGLGMVMSAFMYLSKNPQITEGFKLIGFPAYMVPFLGLAKLLAGIALVVPKFESVKEWAYAGLAFIFIGAIWAHISTATPFVGPIVFLILLGVSYWLRHKIATAK